MSRPRPWPDRIVFALQAQFSRAYLARIKQATAFKERAEIAAKSFPDSEALRTKSGTNRCARH